MCLHLNNFQVRSVSLKNAGEQARITMKSMESLTYMCTDAHLLMDFNSKLKDLLTDFRSHLPQEEQLVLRPSVVSRALKTKRKYARIRPGLKCSQLAEAKKRGRKKAGSKFRNRFGAKADRLRKVCSYSYSIQQIIINFIYLAFHRNRNVLRIKPWNILKQHHHATS